MQRSIFRPILNSIVLRKHFFRTAALAKHESDVNLKSWKEIPGPACIPGIGPIQSLPGGSLHNLSGTELFQKLYSMYGPIVRLGYYRGVEPLIFLYDVDSASKILRSEDTLPYRPGFESLRYYRENRSENYKQVGLLADQGESWKKFRSTVNPIMLQPKTIKLYAKELDEVAQEMVERIRTFKNDEYKIKNKLNKELNLWSLESIGVVALGCRTGCIRSNISENSPEKRLTDCLEEMMPLITKVDFRPNLWKFVSTPNFRMAMKLLEEHETWAKYFINRSRENLKNKPKNDDKKSVLEKLLEINEQVAYTMATDMLIAGGEVMVHTVINSLYLLAVNPEKQHKLREELKSDHENKYLKAFLKESMRVMPVAGGNIRKTSKAYNILGYKIPEGANVAFMHHEMCMMDEHFKQSKKFIPERWITDKDDPISAKNANIFAFASFGYGSRSCVGRRIAELQLHTFLARFVENFHVEWKGPPPKIVNASIDYTREPYNFTFRDLKQ